MPKVTRFTAKDAEGNSHSWAFWYDKGYKAWFLRDCDGYERRMADTWIDTAPRIRLILHNYDMTAEVN